MQNLFAYVDHTALKPYTTWDEIKKLCQEAIEYGMASVCIPGCYVKRAHETFEELNICTVIGFPLGYNSTESKIEEALQAVRDGACEIDMVINICNVKNKEYDKAEAEIARVKEAVKDNILKVIIETCYLEEEEKIAMCKAVTNAGADYIKTSTGFGTAGASLADVCLMKENIGENVKIKAAGGIKTKEEMEDYIRAGCSRIGTSSAISMLLSHTGKS
ncbi:MAG: deoxyribose-phosphate aldolase [Eubacterium sp.]|jgi:deoxyribose-phosphate aldolase|nr:deoxyribose-phosphate aldolase [Eubacterium sp.]